MSHSLVEVYLHIVFATKHRAPLLTPDIEARLFPYLAGIARRKKVGTLRINGTEDHIHLLQKLHPSVTIARLVGDMKAYGTAFIKNLGVSEFAWQRGYGAFSCSRDHLDVVSRYIERQKEHHRFQSFANEMRSHGARWGLRWIPEAD